MKNAWADLNYAFRGVRKNPGFSLTVIVVLAVGIGGNVAIFSIVNAVLLRPLPYGAPERLMVLWGDVERQVRFNFNLTRVPAGTTTSASKVLETHAKATTRTVTSAFMRPY